MSNPLVLPARQIEKSKPCIRIRWANATKSKESIDDKSFNGSRQKARAFSMNLEDSLATHQVYLPFKPNEHEDSAKSTFRCDWSIQSRCDLNQNSEFCKFL